jgi:plastocyanin
MGKIIAVICFIIGIPTLLFGALIFTGLSIAGIVGSSLMIPAVIFASALLFVGALLMFIGWRNHREKKILSINAYDHSSNVNTSTRNRASITKGLVVAIIVVTMGLTSVIAIGATIIIPLMDEVSFDTDDSESSSAVNTDYRERETTTTTTNIETTIAMKDSNFEPQEAQIPLNDDIVWVNDEDDPPHTATSGTGADDPESGKIFDTGIINDGDHSAPLQLTGVKVGDEISYYCMVHPSMTGKLIVTSPTTGQNTTTTA